jgi:folate-binding Fe-S cluster repair protein YgfZ
MAALLRSLIPNVPTMAPVPHRAILSVAGIQASEFLNGILASSVHEPSGGPSYSALLHPQAGNFVRQVSNPTDKQDLLN